MKKYYCILMIGVLLAMVYGNISCTSGNDKLQAMIPDDAVGVMEINVHSVLSKAGMLNDNAVAVPSDLKKVIDDSAPSVLGDIIYNLPQSGIDTTCNSYIFFSPGIYKAVALLPLTDEAAAQELVHKITSSKMQNVDGVDFATHLDYAYVVEDDVLLIGRYSTPVEAGVAARAASEILGKKKPSLLSRDEVAECLSDSCDMSLYLNIREFATILKKNSRFSTFFGNVPAIEIITDSDIKALTATLDLDVEGKKQAKVETHILYQENGQYQQLFDNLIAAKCDSASSILKLIPGELETYVGLKIDGNKLSQMPQMSKMYEMLDATPLTSGLKIKDMLAAINGATVIGVGESTVGGYNFAIASQSSNPQLIVNEIVDVANLRGQSPMQNDGGEYVYDYDSQGIAMGQTDNAFYLRCVDFATGGDATGLQAEFQARLDSCAVTIFKIMKMRDNIEGYFNWGLKNKSEGYGFYRAKNENSNVAISLLKLLCYTEQDESLGENEDDYDYGF